MATIAENAARGAKVLLLSQAVRIGAQLLGLIVLSRLLTPADFGIAAVTIAILGIGEVLRDAGLGSASVRQRSFSDSARSGFFWLSTCLGLAFASLLVALAYPLSTAFALPPLHSALTVASVVFLVNGVGSQYRADLNRKQRFRSMAIADGLAATIGLLAALLAALAGFGYWAIIAQYLVGSACSMSTLLIAGRWMPGRPRRVRGMGETIRLGVNITLAQVASYIGNNADTIALGMTTSPGAVGVYNRSFQLTIMLADAIKSPSLSVALPALSRLGTDAPARDKFLLHAQVMVTFLIVPGAAILAATASSTVELVLGPGWTDAVPLVTVLAGAAAVQQLASVAAWIFISTGAGSALHQYSLASALLKIAGIVSFLHWGPIGVAWGYGLAVLFAWPLAIIWSTRTAGIRWHAFMWQGARMLAIGFTAGVGGILATRALPSAPAIIQTAVGAMIVLTIFSAFAFAIPATRREGRIFIRGLRSAIGRRTAGAT